MTDARGVDTGRENVERVADLLTDHWVDRFPTASKAAALLRALVTERDTLLATDAARQKDHEEAEGDCREALSRLRELLSGALDEARAERDEARAEAERLRAAIERAVREDQEGWLDVYALRDALSAPAPNATEGA